MFSDEEDVLFSDLKLEDDTNYFLYIGEIKTDALNQFVKENLARIHNKKFDYISILPDVMESYPHKNVLVINPLARSLYAQTSKKFSCRMSAGDFAGVVSYSSTVLELVRMLVRKQGRLYVHVFESLPELSFTRMPGVVLLGPGGQVASMWNNKLYQLQMLKDAVPVIDYKVCSGVGEMVQGTTSALAEWTEGVFVSQPYSAAGTNSFIVRSMSDLNSRLPLPQSTYFISRYVPHEHDPTVLGVVGNEDDVFIAAIADQEIEGGNMFRGSTFPSVLPYKDQLEIKEHTRMVGRVLGRSGYRGIFGCDYIVSNSGRIYFVEVNARKQGTTMEMCCTLENLLPQDAPTLMELEYFAVTENRLPENKMEIQEAISDLYWRTYNFKVDREVVTKYFLPADEDERELFRQVKRNGVEYKMIIMEHVGHGCPVKPGTFLGRVVAVSRKREILDREIKMGKQLLEESITSME
ncbi:ATP-grasp domain-containing protein [Desulfonatronovibrio hydrogenovorans]|uniref:ATP-grasp domain-containing protein n=1 Tax=Desulfonatronovibrio hydrogenovorans TaxID=53245 RepID=UPI00048BABE7|nr:ATP-grasp domain-containing protein [Desulfonatronovibrio hydrogenovorans]